MTSYSFYGNVADYGGEQESPDRFTPVTTSFRLILENSEDSWFDEFRGQQYRQAGEWNVDDGEDQLSAVRDLADLRLLLAENDDGFERFVAPSLGFGAIWLIPDEVSGFGEKAHHPWIIVSGYSPERASVIACPRTTLLRRQRGLRTPAGMVEGLDKEGVILLRHRRAFAARDFNGLPFLGYLPDQWCQAIREYYRPKQRGWHE